MLRRPQRRMSGVSIVEFVASIAFGLPLLLVITYVVLEANYYFAIVGQMELAARRAAAVQAAWYNQHYPTTSPAASSCMADQCNANTALDIPGFVYHGDSQFTVTFSSDISSPAGTAPYTVTVTCNYPPGGDPAHGLLPFPTVDPLNIGPGVIAVAPINATATFNVLPEQ